MHLVHPRCLRYPRSLVRRLRWNPWRGGYSPSSHSRLLTPRCPEFRAPPPGPPHPGRDWATCRGRDWLTYPGRDWATPVTVMTSLA